MDYKITAPARIVGEVALPASKSISNRALIVNAFAGNSCRIDNIAKCDDTDAMTAALASEDRVVNIGAAGTAMRFLTAYFSLCEGRRVTLDGTERMRHRPIKVLVDALNACGADVRYAGQEGYPPLEITGKKYRCEEITIASGTSSQYVSAILMAAPAMGCRRVTLTGEVISRPYIEMTLGVMRSFGVEARFDGNSIVIEGEKGYVAPESYMVESDWSAASYWYAMQSLLPESRITMKGLWRDSLQGDCRVASFFEPLGVGTSTCGTYVDLRSMPSQPGLYELDMAGNPDLAQTMAVVLCLQERKFRLTGLKTLRIKETDRLEALRTQLLKIGYEVEVEGDDALSWSGKRAAAQPIPSIATFDDHRMAMSFAPAAIKFPGIVIQDAEVVGKSYPGFWKQLALSGFKIEEVAR